MREIYAWLLGAVALVLIGATSAPAQTVLPPYAPIVCAYNSSFPTLTSGQMGWVQCDSHGQLITSGGGGGGGGTVTQGPAASSGPWIFTPWIAGAVNSATNGIYSNLLQGNAALSLTNPLFVAPATAPSAIYSGQQTATTSAAALPSQAFVNGVILKSIVGNTGTIYIGPSTVTTSHGYPLTAGEAISYSIANSSTIYMIGTNATDKLAITGN